MARMFISYSREDQGLVRRLVEDIESLGHTAWFDEELSGGQVWWDEVLNQIRTCDVFVVAISPATINSTACKREYGYADAVGKSLLPVVVREGFSTNLLPPALSRVQLIAYLRQDRSEALRLARAIGSLPPVRPLPDPLPRPPDVPISYLGHLTEKIESLSALDYDEQSALLIDLRRGMQDPETRDDSRTLLKRFRKRRDLFAAIAEEIDLIVRVAHPVSGPAMAAAPAVIGTPEMAPGVFAPSLEALESAPPSLVALGQTTAPTAIERTAPAATDTSLNVARPIMLLVIGPLGWLIIFRRSVRHVITIIAATVVLVLLSSVFFAKGDGIDGYWDDAWEYMGGLLATASWWWPFVLPSYRARLSMAAASAVAPLGPAPGVQRTRRSELANAFVGIALTLLVPLWIGISLDEYDELSLATLMENLPVGLVTTALLLVWVVCSRGWAKTQSVALGRGGTTLRSALVLFRPTRPTGWAPIVSWHIGLVALVAFVVAWFVDPEPLDGETVMGLVFFALLLVGILTAARGWALAFRHAASLPLVASSHDVKGDRVTVAERTAVQS